MEKYEEAQPAYNWSHKKVGSRGDEEDKGWKFPHLMNTLKLQIQKEQQISSGRNTRKNQPKSYPNQTAEALGVSWWSGGLVGVRTWCFHHCGPGSNPWSRSHIKPLHSIAKKRRGEQGRQTVDISLVNPTWCDMFCLQTKCLTSVHPKNRQLRNTATRWRQVPWIPDFDLKIQLFSDQSSRTFILVGRLLKMICIEKCLKLYDYKISSWFFSQKQFRKYS